MALENQISISFTNEELQQLDSHLAAIEDLFPRAGAEENGWRFCPEKTRNLWD